MVCFCLLTTTGLGVTPIIIGQDLHLTFYPTADINIRYLPFSRHYLREEVSNGYHTGMLLVEYETTQRLVQR